MKRTWICQDYCLRKLPTLIREKASVILSMLKNHRTEVRGLHGFLTFCLFFVVVLPFVNAGAIGISPAHHRFFFEPNLERELVFYVSSSEPGQIIETYIAGDLAEYANLSTNRIVGSGNLIVTLKLPGKIEIPGQHTILIGAKEGGNINEENATKQGVGGIVAVQAPIDILVPFPGKYAESIFNIESINVGENVKFNFEINNLGTEAIIVSPNITVYDIDGNELLLFNVESRVLGSKLKWNYEDKLNTSHFEPGVYSAILYFDYGKPIKIEKSFKVGYLFVNITNYSYLFEKGKINKFSISVENLWNLPIEDVFGWVGITINGTLVDKLNTPTIKLDAWGKGTLIGFFDASDVDEGRYLASINVVYNNETTNRLVAIYVNKVPVDRRVIIAEVAVGLFVLVSVSLIIYLMIKIKRLKRLEGNNEKKKKK
jgi:hypothetical protein